MTTTQDPRPTRRFFALATVLTVAGCQQATTGEPESSGDEIVAPSQAEISACAKAQSVTNSAGDKVVRCTETYADGDALRLPPDAMESATPKFYAALSMPLSFGDPLVIWTRTGRRLYPVDADGQPIGPADGKLPRALHAPTNRVTYTIYQLSGKLTGTHVDTSVGPAEGIRLKSARAALELDGCLLDSSLLGTWEGTASARLADAKPTDTFGVQFDAATRVPLRLTFSSLQRGNLLQDYSGGDRIADATTYKLQGTLDNYAKEISENETVYPSLQSLGQASPFAGAQNGDVELYRLGNMHGLEGDAHWVLTFPQGSENLTLNGMSDTLLAFTAPALFVAADAPNTEMLHGIEVFAHLPYGSNGQRVVLSPRTGHREKPACPR